MQKEVGYLIMHLQLSTRPHLPQASMQATACSCLVSSSPGYSQSRPPPRAPSQPGKHSLQPKMLDSCTSSSTTRSTNTHIFLSRIRAESLVQGPPKHHYTPCSSPGERKAANYLGNQSTVLLPTAKQLPVPGVMLYVGHPIPELAG